MKVAIVADWLVTFGGAEHVLAEIHSFYPDAPLYTTVAKKDALGPLKNAAIHTTRLQRLYRLIGNHQVLLPLMPRAIEEIDVTGFDVIISSSHAVAKGVIVPPSALHICYCHTPMRYAWEMEEDYLRDFHIPAFLIKTIKQQLTRIRRWDMTTAQRVDHFIANSTTTQERIKRIYARESVVITPPVEDRFFGSEKSAVKSEEYFLAVGRLVPYKRFDLLIEGANALKLPLKIVGKGQDELRLRTLAGPTIEFLGFVSDDDLPALYTNAKALLFPQYEDAGIVPLEAQACGTPVIAYKAGGALDSIRENITGLFFETQTAEALRSALEQFRHTIWDRAAITEHATQFSQERFRRNFTQEVERVWGEFRKGSFRRY